MLTATQRQIIDFLDNSSGNYTYVQVGIAIGKGNRSGQCIGQSLKALERKGKKYKKYTKRVVFKCNQ